MKAILWTIGIVVVLLLALALATGGGKKKPRAKTRPGRRSAACAVGSRSA